MVHCQKKRPHGPSRRVSPYSVTSTGPDVHRGVRVPSSHQQSDKASDDQWFEPEPATTAMLAYAELRNEMRANATKKPEKGEGHEINCCETLRRPC